MRGSIFSVKAFCAVTVALLGFAFAAPAGAATQVATIDPTGAVFTCGATQYTVTGGTLQVVEGSTATPSGTAHLSLKRIPHQVTLTDGSTDAVYRLVGAGSSNGNIRAAGDFAFTDVTHFHILAPGGSVVGTVATVLRVNANGTGFAFDFGNCQTPQT